MIVLGIKYDPVYRHVYLNRVEGDVVTEIARMSFGDPVLDWRMMRLVVAAMKRNDQEVHRGLSCDRFLQTVAGYFYDENGRLRREGDDAKNVDLDVVDSGSQVGDTRMAISAARAHTR